MTTEGTSGEPGTQYWSTGVDRDLRKVEGRVEGVDQKLDAMDQQWKAFPNRLGHLETNLESNTKYLDNLKWRSEVHSSQIRQLKDAYNDLRTENEALRDELYSHRGPPPPREERYGPRDSPTEYKSPRGFQGDSDYKDGEREKDKGRDEYRDPKYDETRYLRDPRTSYAQHYDPYYRDRFALQRRIVGSGNGLVFVRFSDNSFREMRNGLDKIKTTGLGSFGGKILGVARKDSIYLLDGNYDSGWEIPRRKGTSGPHTENSVLVLLFPDFDRANNFFLSTKNNALFQGDFPSPNGYEALYLKMNASGIDAGNVTFLVMEFPQAARQEYAITQYETELRKLEDGFRGRLCVANTTPQRIDRRPWFIHRNAWMQVHTFPSIADAQEFRSSAGFRRATDALTKVTGAYNAFAFTLKEMTTVEPY